ncbi:DUF4411 family protein [Candidatus Poriferisodalis sp.]|uniref:DUF4411 family protein n=1 Tax=Candidatus Poriferisodalis sp. TaxID=3101277 RepID=UPI003B58BE12
MAYLLDTDVFIRAKNEHYGFDLCPGSREWLETTNSAGTVHSVKAVYHELIGGDDDLAQWARNHRSFFLPPTAADIESIAAVNRWANDSSSYEAAAKDDFARAADSFLIGQALAGSHTVVTHETVSDGRRKIKIPNAATAHNVEVMNPFKMLRAMGVRFVLESQTRQLSLLGFGTT